MDTLTILNKLKKKRPELKSDPLFAELEEISLGAEPEENAIGLDGSVGPVAPPRDELSYLDDAAPEEGEAEADDAMAEMDAEMDAEAPLEDDMAYLDEEGEEEPPVRAPAKKRKAFGRPVM